MSRKRIQVTCKCSAYPFCHRIGGGKCDGSDWATSYAELDGSMCEGCPCNNNYSGSAQGERFGSCDVSEALESHVHCGGYQEHLLSQPITRLPMSLEVYLSDAMTDDRYGDYEGSYA